MNYKHLKNNNMKTSGQVLIGILCAASAGVLIGMLIAPEKGEDLRKDIKSSANDLMDKLSSLLMQGKNEFDNIEATAENESAELKDEAIKAYKKAKA
jgi:gas vesicle protein